MINPEELYLCKGDCKNSWLFDCHYVIPLYQREYAWHWEDEITRLISDIESISDSESNTYRLGCMSVLTRTKTEKTEAEESSEFEVIDGQQRLTTIYLLLTALEATNTKSNNEIISPENGVLTFKGREASNYTLYHVRDLHREKTDNTAFQLDNGIDCAYRGLLAWAKKLDEQKREKFLKHLKQTTIYRIPVPEETDLCKYFIRMNSRGKQLELSDILKARLMKHLISNEDLAWFNYIWTACSNMNTYLQKSKELSTLLNSQTLQEIPFPHQNQTKQDVSKPETLSKFVDRLLTSNCIENISENQSNPTSVSNDFESFIDFPTFLMHVLKLCAKNKNKETKCLHDSATDDKRLLSFFEDNWQSIFGQPLTPNQDSSSCKHLPEETCQTARSNVMEFIHTLAVARYLYDGWILKRAGYQNEKDWVVRHLDKTTDKLINSFGEQHRKILMIQACLRVTYTSPLSMSWVTELLHLLWQHRDNLDGQEQAVLTLLEGIAAHEVREKLPDMDKGTGTPRILFNFLDYLLWRKWHDCHIKTNDKARQKFQFAYWNSVEHWYPQNPDTSGAQEKVWSSVDTFGNLFLLNSGDNSSLSNLPPYAKLLKLQERIDEGKLSLKAIDMMRATKKAEQEGTTWQAVCQTLATEHIRLLKEAAGLES